MAKIMKVVWPRGKHLKPAPAGLAPKQEIPEVWGRSRAMIWMNELPALEEAMLSAACPSTRSDTLGLPADPEQRVRQMVNVLPPRASKAMTATDRGMAPAPVTAARLREQLSDLPPVPKAEPIKATPAQMEALKMLPPMPDDLLDKILGRTLAFGTAVVVAESNPTSSAIEIHWRELESNQRWNQEMAQRLKDSPWLMP